MVDFLESYLVDDCVLDVVFDLVRSVKSAQSPIQELFCNHAGKRSTSPVDVAAVAAEAPVALPATDIFENLAPFRESNVLSGVV